MSYNRMNTIRRFRSSPLKICRKIESCIFYKNVSETIPPLDHSSLPEQQCMNIHCFLENDCIKLQNFMAKTNSIPQNTLLVSKHLDYIYEGLELGCWTVFLDDQEKKSFSISHYTLDYPYGETHKDYPLLISQIIGDINNRYEDEHLAGLL